MKTTIGLVLVTEALAGQVTSSYSLRRVNEARRHLEKVYGKGLTEMYNENGHPTRERLSWARTRPSSIWM